MANHEGDRTTPGARRRWSARCARHGRSESAIRAAILASHNLRKRRRLASRGLEESRDRYTRWERVILTAIVFRASRSRGAFVRCRTLALICASLTVFAGVAASCRRDRRPIVIGYAFPLSTSATVRVAEEELAATRTPRDGDLTLVLDSITQGDPPDVEVQRAQHLASVPGIVGVVGHGGSRGSLVAAAVYNEAKVPQIVPTSTSRLLATAGPWTFQLPPNDSVEGAFIAAFAATTLRARRVTVFYVNDEYGAGLRDGLVAELGPRHVAVLDQVSFESASDFPTLVAAALRRGVPDALVVAGRQWDTGKIARAAWRTAPGLRVVAGDGALVLPAIADAAGPAADSIYAVAFWLADGADSLSRAFVARFRRLAGREPQSAEAMTHDALLLLATAARTAGPNRAAIRDYLLSLGRARPPFWGVTGPITFARDHPPRLVMARLHGHSVVRVNPP